MIGAGVRALGSAGHGPRAEAAVPGRVGRAEVVPRHDRLHARVPLADVGDAGGAVGVAGEADAVAVEQVRERVVGRVEAGGHAAVLLGRVAGARLAARARHERPVGRGEEEVERVDGAVVERAPVALRRHALVRVGSFAEQVRLPLPLRVERENDVAGLGQRLGRVPVLLLGGLDGAVGDHHAGPLRRPGPGGPDVARDRGAVARRPQHRLDEAVALRPPVVQPRVAGAAVFPAGAQVGGEIALGVGDLRLPRRERVGEAHAAQQQLALGRAVDRRPLGRLGDVAAPR